MTNWPEGGSAPLLRCFTCWDGSRSITPTCPDCGVCQFCGVGPDGEHSRRCHEQALDRVAELEAAIREHRSSSTFSITEGVYSARDSALYAALKDKGLD